MFQDMKEHVHDFDDEDEICDYLRRLLHKQAFDKQGLIYGMGHAVYSISDPRAQILKKFTGRLSAEKGWMPDFRLLQNVEKLAPKVIAEERHIYKGVSANVDFYSGFVYSMLGFRWNCTPPFLPWPVWWAGAPTAWKNCLAAAKSSARLIAVSRNTRITFPWTNANLSDSFWSNTIPPVSNRAQRIHWLMLSMGQEYSCPFSLPVTISHVPLHSCVTV